MNEKEDKVLYLELLRILACFAVIFIHTQENGFFLFSYYTTSNIRIWLYLFISISCCFATSLFFSISGSILITKTDGKWKNCKRILKYFCILLIFSFITYFNYVSTSGNQFNLKIFLARFYAGDINIQLWFLYSYISYLLFLPFIRVIAQNLSNKNYLYLFFLATIFKIIVPIIQLLIFKDKYTINPDFYHSTILDIIFLYPLIGYYIHTRISINKIKKNLSFLWLINIVTILFSCFLSYYKVTVSEDYSVLNSRPFHDTFNIINVFTIFCTFKCLFNKEVHNGIIKRIILSLGSSTLWIYLIHPFVMQKFQINKVPNFLKITPMISSFIYIIIILIICYFIVFLCKFILKLLMSFIKQN